MKKEFKEPTLWKHQEEAVTQPEIIGLLWDPGTGKTLTQITKLRRLYNEEKKILPTLILAPVIVLNNWKDEWLKFSKMPEERIIILSGPTKKRIKMVEAAKEKFGGNFIAITNYEALTTRGGFFECLQDWGPVCIVADESHRIKNHTSKRSKQTIKLGDKASHKFILTGTPILNSPMDIFAQFRFLDGGRTFGRNFYTFRNIYFYDKNASMPKDRYFPNWVVREDTYEEMNKKIYEKCSRAVKSQCLDLPPLVTKTINVPMSPEQSKLYAAMERDFIAFLDESDATIVAQLAITKTLRMRQILSGFVKTDEEKIVYLKESPRIKALEELLEMIATNHKVLVWSVFVPEYELIRRVCEKLKLTYVEAHGGISNKAKYEAVDKFNNDPDVRVFIGHPGSLGIGINLVASSYSIYLSRSYSLEERDQSQARNYRGGSEQHESITHIDIVAPETIDEVILQAIENKTNVAEAILEWRKTK